MAKSPKTIGLPLAKELRSNKLEDIQHQFELFKTKLDNMYKFLLSDITTIQIGGGSALIVGDFIYFNGKDVAGSWRIGKDPSGTSWLMQFFEGGAYVSKGGATI